MAVFFVVSWRIPISSGWRQCSDDRLQADKFGVRCECAGIRRQCRPIFAKSLGNCVPAKGFIFYSQRQYMTGSGLPLSILGLIGTLVFLIRKTRGTHAALLKLTVSALSVVALATIL